MLANVDGLCEDDTHGPCIFEAKTASAYKVGEWGGRHPGRVHDPDPALRTWR